MVKRNSVFLFILFSILTFSCAKKNDYSSIEFAEYRSANQTYTVTKIFPNGNYRVLIYNKDQDQRFEFSGMTRMTLVDSINKIISQFRNEKVDVLLRNSNLPNYVSHVNSSLLIKGGGYDYSVSWGNEYHNEPALHSASEIATLLYKIPSAIMNPCTDSTVFETIPEMKTNFGE